MPYGLYRKGKGGTLRKLKGDPRGARNQKNLIVWDTTKKGVFKWIRKWGTDTQKIKHLGMKPVSQKKRKRVARKFANHMAKEGVPLDFTVDTYGRLRRKRFWPIKIR